MSGQTTKLHEKMDGAPHSKQSLRLWLRILSCTMLIEGTIRNRLREHFNTTLPRFDVLSALHRAHDGLSMGELSRMLMVSNGNVTGVVTRLVSDGLVERNQSLEDRRTHVVTLTKEGETAFNAMADAHEAWIDELFAAVSNEDAERLLVDLRRVQNSAIGNIPEKKSP